MQLIAPEGVPQCAQCRRSRPAGDSSCLSYSVLSRDMMEGGVVNDSSGDVERIISVVNTEIAGLKSESGNQAVAGEKENEMVFEKEIKEETLRDNDTNHPSKNYLRTDSHQKKRYRQQLSTTNQK